mgnify:CR=1 FL=1
MDYLDELTGAMWMLGRHPKAIFVGQGVAFPGTSLVETLRDVPMEKRIEFPVAEDMQTGFCTGLSLDGWIPICIFPRWNFVLCAAQQIVGHLDRIPLFSDYRPKVIIRIGAPHDKPLDAGPQHTDDFTDAFELMFRTIQVERLRTAEDIRPAYERALEREGSTLLVEYTKFYSAKPR